MNTTKIKLKMKELGASASYVAGCCNVSEHYFNQIMAGSKPMTKKLHKNVKAVLAELAAALTQDMFC